jgi:hypothetical protein
MNWLFCLCAYVICADKASRTLEQLKEHVSLLKVLLTKTHFNYIENFCCYFIENGVSNHFKGESVNAV